MRFSRRWIGGLYEANLDKMTTYVRNQEEHHRTITTFQDEYRQLLREHGIEWDERYLWD